MCGRGILISVYSGSSVGVSFCGVVGGDGAVESWVGEGMVVEFGCEGDCLVDGAVLSLGCSRN